MKAVDEPDTNRFPEPGSANNALASWYAPGPSDELGDRLLMFDNSSAPSLELLRFRPELSANPEFEAALRERVERLSQFAHPSFTTIRAVEHLGPNDGLALVSNFTPGRRLSEVLQDARGPAFATALIQLLAPALASLRQQGDGTGHGALATTRIIITPEGRLVIVEHALGSALERLRLAPDRLRTEFGIVVPPTRAPVPRLDIRADYFQLGIIALSLLVGRQIGPDVSRDQIERLLAQVATTAERESPVLFRRLRVWLERALQLDGEIFRSPSQAQDALNNVADPGRAPRTLQHTPPRAIPAHFEPPQAPVHSYTPHVPTPVPDSVRGAISGPISNPSSNGSSNPSSNPSSQNDEQRDIVVAAREPEAVAVEPIAAPEADGVLTAEILSIETVDLPSETPAPAIDWKTKAAGMARQFAARSYDEIAALRDSAPQLNLVQTLAAIFALCVLGEALAIAMLLNRRAVPVTPAVLVETAIPGADVVVDGRSAGTTPLQLTIGRDMRSIRVVEPRPPVPTAGVVSPEIPARAARPDAPNRSDVATTSQRAGGIRLAAPFDLEVFEGDSRLGSSSTGIVSVPVGRREIELVNSQLGYRVRRVIDVKAGRVTPLEISPPNGLLSINAAPWAEVWIDGKPAGETPLANLSVSLGEHEILFRHPDLGEQRRKALVRVDGVTRVSVSFQR